LGRRELEVDGKPCAMQDENVLDEIIDRLLEVKDARPGKLVPLTENEVSCCCSSACED